MHCIHTFPHLTSTYLTKVVRFVLRGDNMDSLFRLSRKVGDVLEQNLPPADPQAEEPAGLERVVGPYDEGRQEMSINLDIAFKVEF